jgi:hypothetical protein
MFLGCVVYFSMHWNEDKFQMLRIAVLSSSVCVWSTYSFFSVQVSTLKVAWHIHRVYHVEIKFIVFGSYYCVY